MLLADNETKIDLINNEPIAKTIIQLLLENPCSPVTIGVHGDWGAGKSSILEMIEQGLESHEDVLCLKFNGWRFQGFEDAKIALMEGIVTALLEKRSNLTKATDAVKDIFNRINWLKVAKNAGGLAVTAFTGLPNLAQIKATVSSLESLFTATKRLTKKNVLTSIGEMKELLEPISTKNVPEEILEFRKLFENLLINAQIKQLIVLIDDLDRCLPDTAIETLEAIRLFVFTASTAFVVASDEAMIEYAVRKHFPDLPESTGPRDYARNYLEKLIQIPFRIPALGEAETRIYVTLLLVGTILGEREESYQKLISEAKSKLQRPWENMLLNKPILENKTRQESVEEAFMISDQISPLLVGGTTGNPRQIKRFLNSLLLRQRIADAQGFGEEIKLPALAKLMLAERFHSIFFNQIADSALKHADGFCPFIKMLETQEENIAEKNTPDKNNADDFEEKSDHYPENTVLEEWLNSDFIMDWSRLSPPLGTVDLRPYLFIARDKKDYWGMTTALGKLAPLAKKLCGAKIEIATLKTKLKQLTSDEARGLFEHLHTQILGSNFQSKPLGVDGIIALVEAQPLLQEKLISLLERLPISKCGIWVIGGWNSAFQNKEILERFSILLNSWAHNGPDHIRQAIKIQLNVLKEG